MKITQVKLTKEKLAMMPAKDRALLLTLGTVSNEINVLQKLMLVMIRRDDSPSKIVDIVEAGQVLIFQRILIGKLHEAHKLLKVRVMNDGYICNRYRLKQDWEHTNLLVEVDGFFKKNGMFDEIRNGLAFHFTDKKGRLEMSFQALGADQPWDFYLSETLVNSFYYASELVFTKAAIQLTQAGRSKSEDSEARGFEELCDKTTDAAKLVSDLFAKLMIEIIDKSIPGGLEADEVEINDDTRTRDVHIPFFLSEDRLRHRRS